MAEKPESRLRKKIAERLRSLGATVHVYHGGIYAEVGHSDLYGTFAGRPYYLEVKVPDWKPSSKADRDRIARQQLFLDREAQAGAATAVVHSPDEAEAALTRH